MFTWKLIRQSLLGDLLSTEAEVAQPHCFLRDRSLIAVWPGMFSLDHVTTSVLLFTDDTKTAVCMYGDTKIL